MLKLYVEYLIDKYLALTPLLNQFTDAVKNKG